MVGWFTAKPILKDLEKARALLNEIRDRWYNSPPNELMFSPSTCFRRGNNAVAARTSSSSSKKRRSRANARAREDDRAMHAGFPDVAHGPYRAVPAFDSAAVRARLIQGRG